MLPQVPGPQPSTTDQHGPSGFITCNQQNSVDGQMKSKSVVRNTPCSRCSKHDKDMNSSLGSPVAMVHTAKHEPLPTRTDMNESHLRKSWWTFGVILVLLGGWIMCADTSPSLITATDMKTSWAKQSILRPPSSILTEGGTENDRRSWPKPGEACRKVMT